MDLVHFTTITWDPTKKKNIYIYNTQLKAIQSITINIAFFTQVMHLYFEYNLLPIFMLFNRLYAK
jgi:hypothetical protein